MEMILTIILAALSLSGVTMYGLYSRAREILTADIRNLLEDCRRLSSWDDRSELKLMSWVEGDERKLHKKSVHDLHRVRNSMLKYFQIHCEMKEDEEFGSYQTPAQSYISFFFGEVLGFQKTRWK